MTSRPRKFLLPLSIAAIAILVAGIWLGRSRHSTEPSAAVGTKVLPSLAGKLNDVNEIRIVKPGEVPFVTLKRAGDADQKDSWQVAERGGYPADFTKVREFLLKLSELKVVEEKTSNPESYAALGVEDVKSDKATGKRVDLKGIEPPVGLIVGKSANYSGNYVRVIGNEKSVHAKPQVTIYDGPSVWLNRSTLFDLKEEDVQEVRVSGIGKPDYLITRSARDQHDFTVPNLPRGRKLSSPSEPGTNAALLTNLSFEDVRPLGKDEDWSKDSRVVFRYFDGTVITAIGRKIEAPKKPKKEGEPEVMDLSGPRDQAWVRFEVSFDEAQHQKYKPKTDKKDGTAAQPAGELPQIVDEKSGETKDDAATPPPPPKTAAEVRAAAEKLNAQLKNWVYDIQGYRYDNTFRTLDELLEKK